MKNLLIACSLIILSPLAHADFWGVKADVGIWQPDYDGDFEATQNNLKAFSHGSESNAFFHISIEHPVPFIPNFRLGYSDINSHKTITLNDLIEDTDIVDLPTTSLTTDIDLTHIDATAYYEFLDNWVNLDLGISLRQLDGTIGISSVNLSESITLDEVLPMAYILAEVELPFTGWSVGAEGSFTEFEDYGINDYTLKVRYLLDSVLDVGFEAGYRVLQVDISKSFGADIKLAGPFVALAFHF